VRIVKGDDAVLPSPPQQKHRPGAGRTEQSLSAGLSGSVFFIDDKFIGNRRHLKTERAPVLIAWQQVKEGLSFYAEASIDLSDDGLMAEAGFGSDTPSIFLTSWCFSAPALSSGHHPGHRCLPLSHHLRALYSALKAGFLWPGFAHESSGSGLLPIEASVLNCLGQMRLVNVFVASKVSDRAEREVRAAIYGQSLSRKMPKSYCNIPSPHRVYRGTSEVRQVRHWRNCRMKIC
jgi:hypothetical protein